MNKSKKLFARALYLVFALALVAGLTLVPAVAADSPADTDVGYTLVQPDDSPGSAATWDDGQKKFGSYSVKLYHDGIDNSGDLHVEFIPPSGITFADFQTDIAGADDKWSFWNYAQAVTTHHAQFELRFTDPASSDYFDIMFVQHTLLGAATWLEVIVDKDVVSFLYWGPGIGDSGAIKNFADLLGHETDALDHEDYEPYELTTVQVEQYMPEGDERIGYIDDITIDGVTYELEPIFLDAEYYSVGDTVQVTVPNFAANTDSIRTNPVTANCDTGVPRDNWTVTATSDSDTGAAITVALEETGADTGVFTGSFAITNTVPVAEDEVYVEDGSIITITYLTSDDDWGTLVESTTIITVLVDDTAPTITVPEPLVDGAITDDRTPDISATYADSSGGSDINTDSVEIIFEDVDVTDEADVDDSGVTYTPEDDLDDGSYDVTVNVSDNAGNAAITESWSFRVVSWLVDTETGTGDLDALDTVGVAVSGAGTGEITVGRYASNPEPDAPPTFSLIENGFFDVKVTGSDATLIVIKFADANITAESKAYVWGETEGEWLECSDQGYNSVADPEYLWVKVRATTIPSIAELEGTPFGISGEEAAPEDILDYYRGEDDVVSTSELLTAITDWAAGTIPSGFTEALTTTQLLTLITEWAS